MINWPTLQRLFSSSRTSLIGGGLLLLIFCVWCFLIIGSQAVAAAQTVPYKVNFQGRLADATGVSMPDGLYNMTFRLFSGATGGSAVWTEVRQTTSRVTLTNGQFNVQLGDVSALSPSLFTAQPLYLEVELPTPASATCSTAACAVYTEGPMTPRQPLASSPYAMNADTLDGLDSAAFAQLGVGNVYAGTNLFKNASNSSAAFGVQQADGTSLFAVDTSAGAVSLGSGSNPAQFGLMTAGSITDLNEAGTYEMVRYQTGAGVGPTATISAYIGSASIDNSPNNKYKLALYSDNAGVPGTLLATSAEGILTTGWNTLPISATLSPSTDYWLAYLMNSTDGAKGNLNFNNGGVSCWYTRSYVSGFPASSPSCTSGTQAFSMYVTFASSSPALTANSSGMVGIGTISPSATLEVDGTGLYKNLSNSTTAFQIQNAAAASLFVADTTNSRIQIGSPTADGTAVVLVLDTKNTAGDPTGVNGAMYYNSNLGKFRCYEGGAWTNCITAPSPQTVVTMPSDVVNNNATADTLATATGLSFTVVSGTTYHFSALINYTAATTTTGSRWTVTGPASPTTLSYISTNTLTATTQTVNYAAAYGVPAAANAGSLTTGNIATVEGIIKPSASGTVSIQFASGVASSAITAKAGSTLTWW